MKNFDARWRGLAELARGATARDATAPFGFAGRVAARAFPARVSAPDHTLERMIPRFLIGVFAALMACAAMEWRHLRDTRPLEPGIENTVAQLVWLL